MTSEAMTTPAHKTGRTRPRNKLGLMVNRAIRPESVPVLVDLGYLEDKKSYKETPEERFTRVRKWVVSQIRDFEVSASVTP